MIMHIITDKGGGGGHTLWSTICEEAKAKTEIKGGVTEEVKESAKKRELNTEEVKRDRDDDVHLTEKNSE